MKNFLLYFILLFSFSLSAQPAITENSKIYMITCSQGDQLYNTFGHTAIRIKDDAMDVIFNYGIFDFQTENFLLKFLRGKLPYKLGVSKYSSFVKVYQEERRSIYQQELNLSFEERQKVYDFLLENYKPENREYKYDFFFDNCSSRVKDVFKNLTPGFQMPSKIKEVTFREMLDENLGTKPWADFGIDLIIGNLADQQTNVDQQCFLPLYLHDHFSNVFIENEAIVKQEELTLDFIAQAQKKKDKFRFTPFMLFSIFLLLELIFLIAFRTKETPKWKRILDKLWYFILGLGGFIILFMWFGTDHLATKNNWNLLWMNPLFLNLLFLEKINQKANWFLKAILLLLMLLALLELVGIFSPQNFHICIPLIIITTILKFVSDWIKRDRKISA